MKNSSEMKKILFMTPPYRCGVVEAVGGWVPLNLVYLAGAARQAGLEAAIYDAMTTGASAPAVAKRLREENADYVACTAMTPTIGEAVKALETAKQINPASVTILGGVHPSFMFREVLESCPWVDYAIIGEGEVSLRELLIAVENGDDPATVPGIAFRDGDRVVRTGKRDLIESLDDLPAAWDLLDWDDYRYFIIPGSRLAAIGTSRGCDRDCIVCCQQKFWERSWRPRNPLKVADEIEHLFNRYGVNVFLLTDENAARDPKRWEAFLDLLIARQLPVNLIMECTASDLVRDREIVWKYRKAGVIHVSLGIEATDQAQLDLMKDGSYVDEAKIALDLLHENGIVSEAAFVVGFPDETSDRLRYILKLAQYYNPDNAHFMPVTPWPYSDLHEELNPYIRERDYGKYNWIDPVVEPRKMSLQQVEAGIIDCYRKFYMGKMVEIVTMKDSFKRAYLMRAVRLILGSPFIVNKLKTAALGAIPGKLGAMKRRFSTPAEAVSSD